MIITLKSVYRLNRDEVVIILTYSCTVLELFVDIGDAISARTIEVDVAHKVHRIWGTIGLLAHTCQVI